MSLLYIVVIPLISHITVEAFMMISELIKSLINTLTLATAETSFFVIPVMSAMIHIIMHTPTHGVI